MFTAVVGCVLLLSNQFPLRSIFYKQQDAISHPRTYVVGRSIATIPVRLSILFCTAVFFSLLGWQSMSICGRTLHRVCSQPVCLVIDGGFILQHVLRCCREY
jgi:hypothetical protein